MTALKFEKGILLSANLGNDADTTAAIFGQIAGAYYGFSHRPEKWRTKVAMSNDIEQLVIDLSKVVAGKILIRNTE